MTAISQKLQRQGVRCLQAICVTAEWAQTAAVGIALRNAGFGLQFSAAGDDFADMAPDELPASEMDTSREPATMEQPVQAEIEPAYEPAVLTEEQRLEQAFQKPCPIKKYSGKTLGEVLAMDQTRLHGWPINTKTIRSCLTRQG